VLGLLDGSLDGVWLGSLNRVSLGLFGGVLLGYFNGSLDRISLGSLDGVLNVLPPKLK
jgi:hypothetical protein